MVLQRAQRVAVELRIAKHNTALVDESDAVPEGRSRHIGYTVRRVSIAPLCTYESRLAREAIDCLVDDARLKPVVDDQNNGDHEHRNDGQHVEKQPVSEPHRDREFGVRNRYPNPRTVSIRSPAGPSLARKR